MSLTITRKTVEDLSLPEYVTTIDGVIGIWEASCDFPDSIDIVKHDEWAERMGLVYKIVDGVYYQGLEVVVNE